VITAGAPVIIGGGLAGLMTAIHLAPEPVYVVSKTPLGVEASSAWAQGGIAAALGSDDSPGLHLADTLAAADGLCEPDIASRIVEGAVSAVETLARLGVRFDREPDGALCLGLEAAHSQRRTVHAKGDASGREIMHAVVEAVRRLPSIAVLERVEARRLLLRDGVIAGVLAAAGSGPLVLPTKRVVIATGGLGGLFLHTTNPRGSIGQGLMLAARAGAALLDLEFVQFHPTALDTERDPMPLISEAVRGAGAQLINGAGRRFMENEGRAELEPRDVVARAIWRELAVGERVFLDARRRPGREFPRRFPEITAICRAAGLDPVTHLIPLRPAAHYHMGGIAVDGYGRSTVSGLWACGEAACNGLHGANRLAGNSLLEAVVTARWTADSVSGTFAERASCVTDASLPPLAEAAPIRPILSRALGVVRDRATLQAAVSLLLALARDGTPTADPAALGLMLVSAALRRTESRGGHYRSDFPARDPGQALRRGMHLQDVLPWMEDSVPQSLARSA
jgi:L-aspartate oxidase